jgi:hypothetical protein
MSDTPRTDAKLLTTSLMHSTDALNTLCDFARQLEREVATLKAENETLLRERCEANDACLTEITRAEKAEAERDAWKQAAIRVGEDIGSVGPDGYYSMTADQWGSWAVETLADIDAARKK